MAQNLVAAARSLEVRPRLTVIIPIAPDDHSGHAIAQDLGGLPFDSEIFFVVAEGNESGSEDDKVEATKAFYRDTAASMPHRARVICAPQGRAFQLNAGAREARGEWLWFVHADTRIHADAVEKLVNRLDSREQGIFYFDLRFASGGPPLMILNQLGAHFRSRILSLPFGDQAFLLRRSDFEALGGYPEDASFGEDHLFVWYGRQLGLRARPLGASVYTSARKYARIGWAKTTVIHLWLTARQAGYGWMKLCKRRLGLS